MSDVGNRMSELTTASGFPQLQERLPPCFRACYDALLIGYTLFRQPEFNSLQQL
jgi:hypothetical protein